jgi:hypothetical protein
MMITEIYEKLMIPPNLQEHMLRVGAVMEIIAEQWQGPPINIQAMVMAGLGHDLGNIIKFDFSRPEMLDKEVERVAYWLEVQSDTKKKYGHKVHPATLMMAKEMGFYKESRRIIDGIDWERTEVVLKQKDWEVAIGIYADMRIGPMGILSLEGRIDNLNQRRPLRNYRHLIKMAKKLENTLQENITIKLDQVTEADLTRRFERLKQWPVKVKD